MKLCILLCLCLLAHVVMGQRATCDASQCHGRPGIRGPVGSRGIQGLVGKKGEEGTSEALEEKVRILEGSLKELSDGLRSSSATRDAVCYMGMKSGHIPDSAITSSSDFDANNAAHLGRLDNLESSSNTGMWCAANNRVVQWIQVDLGHLEVVAGVITQGSSGHWITAYKVSCGNTGENMATITEHGREKVFSANTDMDTKVVNKFPQLMTCRYIRIYPQSSHGVPCMRLEIIKGICKDIY